MSSVLVEYYFSNRVLYIFSQNVSVPSSLEYDGNRLVCDFEDGSKIEIPLDVPLADLNQLDFKVWGDHSHFKFPTQQESIKEIEKRKSKWQDKLPSLPQIQSMECRFCGNKILKSEDSNSGIQKVLRLPGDHWEEMMDSFWVCACTKPALSQSPLWKQGQNFQPKPGSVYLGNFYLLLHQQNIGEAAFQMGETHNESSKTNAILCKRCCMPLGVFEIEKKNIKLFSHRVTDPTKQLFRNHSIETLLTFQLVSAMNAHKCYRFFIREMDSNRVYIQILITNWDLFILSNDLKDSKFGNGEISPALKVNFIDHYEETPHLKKSILQWENNYEVENLKFNQQDCIGALHILYQHNHMLPPSKRQWPNQMKTSFLFYIPEETVLT
eukprot:TRINITY_DN9414_c0_g1_i1.p1 TRINITY_DN9414_c0_g1~~TRINITY_DN9414_c0_g1_i1.p1  ORF type:complete len:381 (-),score=64.68 TRINITY_DN9414_c0_g1_i1:68-1210(-)